MQVDVPRQAFISLFIVIFVLFPNLKPTSAERVVQLQRTPAKWIKRSKWWNWKLKKNLKNIRQKCIHRKKDSNNEAHTVKLKNCLYHDQQTAKGTRAEMFGPGGVSNSDSFNLAVLYAHNEYRQMHHSPHLHLDEGLNKQAQEYAKELSLLGIPRLRHSKGYRENQYGENIFAACDMHVFPIDPVKYWYFQVCGYDFLAHKAKKSDVNVKDFTQLVWRGTDKLGVGRAIGLYDDKPCTYIVARYLPRSNGGARRNNVDIGDFNKEICKPASSYVGFGAHRSR